MKRPDRHPPPGYGSERHLDFIVTDLDGMLARLCGPDRKIIRLRDKRGIYLFLIVMFRRKCRKTVERARSFPAARHDATNLTKVLRERAAPTGLARDEIGL